MIDEILKLLRQAINFRVGFITEITPATNTCQVKIDDKTLITCKLLYDKASTNFAQQRSWGLINHFDVGDFVLVVMENGNPYVIQKVNGIGNVNTIYDKGKVTINRIPDPDNTDTTIADVKLKLGEMLLRSLGMGDIFMDKIGNIIVDTSKEITFRIGSRDANNIIATPDMTVRFGKIKDTTTGDPKKDGDGKEIKCEIIFDTDNQMVLNEDGKWTIKNSAASVDIQSDGKVVINGGNIEVARNGDDVDIWAALKTWLNTHVHATAAVGAPSPPTIGYNGTLAGTISEGNPNLLCD